MNRDVQLEFIFKYLHGKLYLNFYYMLAKFDTSSSYTNFTYEQIDFFVEGKHEQKQFSLLIFHKIRFWGNRCKYAFCSICIYVQQRVSHVQDGLQNTYFRSVSFLRLLLKTMWNFITFCRALKYILIIYDGGINKFLQRAKIYWVRYFENDIFSAVCIWT